MGDLTESTSSLRLPRGLEKITLLKSLSDLCSLRTRLLSVFQLLRTRVSLSHANEASGSSYEGFKGVRRFHPISTVENSLKMGLPLKKLVCVAKIKFLKGNFMLFKMGYVVASYVLGIFSYSLYITWRLLICMK